MIERRPCAIYFLRIAKASFIITDSYYWILGDGEHVAFKLISIMDYGYAVYIQRA